MPGCIGSLDCCHWEWHKCPTGMAGAYQSRRDKRGIVVKAVCNKDLWVWHLFVGAPGSLNDINVMHQSPLYLNFTGGRWPPRKKTYTINGRTRSLPSYLVDGIYPRFSFFDLSTPQAVHRGAEELQSPPFFFRRPSERTSRDSLAS